jgi:hypothetical protein
LEEKFAKGFNKKNIKIFCLELNKDRHTNHFLNRFKSLLSDEDKDYLRNYTALDNIKPVAIKSLLSDEERKSLILKKDEIKKQREEKQKNLLKTCKHCFFVYSAELPKCPMCNGETETPKELFKTKDGTLVLYDEYATIKKYFDELLLNEKFAGWKPNAKYMKLYEKFGKKILKYKKDFNIPSWVPKYYSKQSDKLITG